MDDEYRAAKTPLIDLLRKVPKDGRHMYDESPVMAHNIPYGRLCHEAADELEAWNSRASQDLASGVTILPDGSGFAIASFPLPNDHWIYAPREYIGDSIEPVELPKPLLSHDQRDTVIAAIRYAVRGATMLGKEMDFDPDALVQNAVYALCGPYGSATVKQAASDEPELFEMDWPEYHYEAMGCGLEDRNICDRYEAMRYGWEEAIERCAECLPEQLFTRPQPAQECEKCKELEEQVHFQSCLTRDLLPYQDEAVKGRDKLAALEAEIERLQYFPKHDVFKTAEMILSDCGCSTEHTRLLEKVRARLFAMIDTTIAQQADLLTELQDTVNVLRDERVSMSGRNAQQAERIKELEFDRLSPEMTVALKATIRTLTEQLAAAEKDASKWKQMAEFQYAIRQYPNNLDMGIGALDAYFKGWNYDAAIAAQKGKGK